MIQIKYSCAIHFNQLRNNSMKTTKILLSIAGAVALATSAHADLIDIQAQWSGASFGNGASATALFTLDTSALNNPGFSSFNAASFPSTFQNFQLTVAGASAGNGAFTGADFSVIFLNTAMGTLDFHSELIGQSTPGGAWGPGAFPTTVGDFNLFSTGLNILTPSGSSIFSLLTGGGEFILLTSFAPASPSAVVAVPETSTWVMGFLALGAVVFMVRRQALRD
ncbi:MAG: hypothetical protein D4R65_09320 [Verrucomicrobiaceae bacterium]|nr:MAG: hypothetical protein D4R65_09320 [Verrucomicrobiaceae bacterium]